MINLNFGILYNLKQKNIKLFNGTLWSFNRLATSGIRRFKLIFYIQKNELEQVFDIAMSKFSNSSPEKESCS